MSTSCGQRLSFRNMREEVTNCWRAGIFGTGEGGQMGTISDFERQANEEFFADHPNEQCPSWCSGDHDSLAH